MVVAVGLAPGGCNFGSWANELITTTDALGFLPGRGLSAGFAPLLSIRIMRSSRSLEEAWLGSVSWSERPRCPVRVKSVTAKHAVVDRQWVP